LEIYRPDIFDQSVYDKMIGFKEINCLLPARDILHVGNEGSAVGQVSSFSKQTEDNDTTVSCVLIAENYKKTHRAKFLGSTEKLHALFSEACTPVCEENKTANGSSKIPFSG
jgi:hypothetical protein